MNNKLILRFAQKKDLQKIIHLCELHATFEQADYNPKQKKEQLSNYLFSDIPSLYCLVVEKDAELIGYATYMKQFSTWDANLQKTDKVSHPQRIKVSIVKRTKVSHPERVKVSH